jgi:hypothetical protein
MDEYEEAMRYDRLKGEFLTANMGEAQRSLCDGNEHFAFFIDGDPTDELLAIVHVKSLKQVLEGKHPEDAALWFDKEGTVPRGYLPCESWDSVYEVPETDPLTGWPIAEGDLHDRHASILMPCSFMEWSWMAENKCDVQVLLQDKAMVDLLNSWITTMREAQERLDQFEADYKAGRI